MAKRSATKKPAAKKTANVRKPAGKPAAKRTTKKKAASKQTAKTTGKKSKREGLSQIAAAIKVLGESKEPMTCKQLVEAMSDKGYWKSPGGKTPHATLAAAIIREMKKPHTQFKKVDRGLFTLA